MEQSQHTGTTGPVLLQGFLQYLCQGVIFTQGIKFWKRSSDDPAPLRIYVSTLVVLSVLQTALESYKVWVVTIQQRQWWTTPIHSTEFLLNALICSFCEAFLIRRCWKVTHRKWWVLVSLGAVWCTTIVANIYLTIRIGRVVSSSSSSPLKASVWAFPYWVYGSLVLAIAVTSILSVYLWKTKTGLNYLDKTLKHIIGIFWESAALPCVCMILAAGFHHANNQGTDDWQHLDLFFILAAAKLYSLGLLRTINSRTDFRDRLHSTDLGTTSLAEFQWNEQPHNRDAATDSVDPTSDINLSPKTSTDVDGNVNRFTLGTNYQAGHLDSDAACIVVKTPEMEEREKGMIRRCSNSTFL